MDKASASTNIPPIPMMPEQKPHRSKQDYSTPDDFIEAFVERFGAIDWDLAASAENTKGDFYYTKEDDGLAQKWHECAGNLWLNPPYEKIGPWAEKCAYESTQDPATRIFFLVPASIGADWYRFYVEPYAYVLALSPRLSFDGVAPYPKDCVLACYINGLTGFKTWRWK